MNYLFLLAIINISCSTPVKRAFKQSSNWHQAANSLLSTKNTWETAAKKGPFEFDEVEDFHISISPKMTIIADYYMPRDFTENRSPLAIFVHGNRSYKEAHTDQAKHLASWGFHTLSLNLPNTNQWIKNSEYIKQLTDLIHNYPKILSNNINPSHIILIGHSFGGSAVSLAVSEKSPVKGLILLDPALYKRRISQLFKEIEVPTILLGADKKIFKSKHREQFFENFSGDFLEVTIPGSTHNDAQSPSLGKINFGIDFTTDSSRQKDFIRAITISAFSLIRKRKEIISAKKAFYQPIHRKKLVNLIEKNQ